MKAILIKYLPETNTKGARLRATTGKGNETLTEGLSYSENSAQQAERLAQTYIDLMGWGCVVSGFGGLPNGDYVATIKNR